MNAGERRRAARGARFASTIWEPFVWVLWGGVAKICETLERSDIGLRIERRWAGDGRRWR
jgi:hypothetical protein